eukprot:9486522-Pyramimonas_sp.AAC.2
MFVTTSAPRPRDAGAFQFREVNQSPRPSRLCVLVWMYSSRVQVGATPGPLYPPTLTLMTLQPWPLLPSNPGPDRNMHRVAIGRGFRRRHCARARVGSLCG